MSQIDKNAAKKDSSIRRLSGCKKIKNAISLQRVKSGINFPLFRFARLKVNRSFCFLSREKWNKISVILLFAENRSLYMNPIIDIPEPLLLGLHALVVLSGESGRCVTASNVAEELGASEGHLAKVLQKLARAGYLDPVHGPGGGYRLAKSPSEINMLAVVELLGGAFELNGCGLPSCGGKNCLIGSLIDELGAAVRDYLRGRTLEDLLRHYGLKPEVRIGVSLGGSEFK